MSDDRHVTGVYELATRFTAWCSCGWETTVTKKAKHQRLEHAGWFIHVPARQRKRVPTP